MAESALYATFTISRGASNSTDVPFGTITGPLLSASCEPISNTKDSTKYQVIISYIAGADQALEYTIIRKTFTHGAAVEVDTALATIAGLQKKAWIIKVSETPLTTTYDFIVLHLNG